MNNQKHLSQIMHEIDKETKIPKDYCRGETVRLSVSYGTNAVKTVPTIEISDSEYNIIVVNTQMIIECGRCGEYGNMTFAHYDFTIDDNAPLGVYRSTILLSGREYSDTFIVVPLSDMPWRE